MTRALGNFNFLFNLRLLAYSLPQEKTLLGSHDTFANRNNSFSQLLIFIFAGETIYDYDRQLKFVY